MNPPPIQLALFYNDAFVNDASMIPIYDQSEFNHKLEQMIARIFDACKYNESIDGSCETILFRTWAVEVYWNSHLCKKNKNSGDAIYTLFETVILPKFDDYIHIQIPIRLIQTFAELFHLVVVKFATQHQILLPDHRVLSILSDGIENNSCIQSDICNESAFITKTEFDTIKRNRRNQMTEHLKTMMELWLRAYHYTPNKYVTSVIDFINMYDDNDVFHHNYASFITFFELPDKWYFVPQQYDSYPVHGIVHIFQGYLQLLHYM